MQLGLIGQALHPPHWRSLRDSLDQPTIHGQPIAPEPDLCVAQKLLQEAGKVVNLHDWFSTFEVSQPERSSAASRTKTKGKRKATAAELEDAAQKERRVQARFVGVVSDLGFLGVIGPTKRKAEHVARVVW